MSFGCIKCQKVYLKDDLLPFGFNMLKVEYHRKEGKIFYFLADFICDCGQKIRIEVDYYLLSNVVGVRNFTKEEAPKIKKSPPKEPELNDSLFGDDDGVVRIDDFQIALQNRQSMHLATGGKYVFETLLRVIKMSELSADIIEQISKLEFE